jgi:hypothetical protein
MNVASKAIQTCRAPNRAVAQPDTLLTDILVTGLAPLGRDRR